MRWRDPDRALPSLRPRVAKPACSTCSSTLSPAVGAPTAPSRTGTPYCEGVCCVDGAIRPQLRRFTDRVTRQPPLHRASIARTESFGAIRRRPDPSPCMETGIGGPRLGVLPSWSCEFDSRHPLSARIPCAAWVPGTFAFRALLAFPAPSASIARPGSRFRRFRGWWTVKRICWGTSSGSGCARRCGSPCPCVGQGVNVSGAAA